MKVIYFSPTGSTKKVTEWIREVFDNKYEEIDLSKFDDDYSKYKCNKDEITIIGVPSYGGRVPEIALERIKKIKGNNSKAIMVVTYGNRDYDDTLLELKDALKENGFNVVAAITSVTEHSIVNKYATGRPNKDDKKEIINFANEIKQKILTNLDIKEVKVKGNNPYRKYSGVPLKPMVSKECKKCGLCIKLCPVNAIPVDNPREIEKEKCLSCMRCIKICPENARKLNSIKLFIASNQLKNECSNRKENELYITSNLNER